MVDAPFEPGTVVDRYTVEAVLGRGGMAVVYRVRHNQLGTLHALKVLSLAASSVRDRLLQEGKVQAVLRHPNIVAVTDVIDVGGAPGLVMEYVRGPSLEALITDRRLTLAQVDEVAAGVLAGVAAAHAKGLIHRDLKPANVMLAVSEGKLTPKVADFGLAKILAAPEGGLHATRSGVTMGTPAYMAPEQIRDAKNVDQRADVYSLGVMLYELVAGVRPHDGADVLEIFTKVAAGTYRPVHEHAPDVPERMVRAIDGALAVEREKRVSTVDALNSLWSGDTTGDWLLREAAAPFSPDALAAINALGGGGDESVVRSSFDSKGVGSASPSRSSGSAHLAAQATVGLTTPFVTVDLHTEATPRPRRWGLVVLGVSGAGLAGGAVVLALIAGAIGLAWTSSTPRAQPPPPVVVAPIVVVPPPTPDVFDVSAPPPVVVPPVVAVAPRPRPVVEQPVEAPAPVVEVPPVVEAPVIAASPGARFEVKGDVTRVYLKPSGGGASFPAGVLPAGDYTIEVFFDDQPTTLKSVQLAEGATFSVTCNQRLRVCK